MQGSGTCHAGEWYRACEDSAAHDNALLLAVQPCITVCALLRVWGTMKEPPRASYTGEEGII